MCILLQGSYGSSLNLRRHCLAQQARVPLTQGPVGRMASDDTHQHSPATRQHPHWPQFCAKGLTYCFREASQGHQGGSWVKDPTTMPEKLSWIPGTYVWKERTDSKLCFNFTHAQWLVHTQNE